MKVLLSAYSCAPNYGSEPGVGWNWAVEVARLGHDVVALTTDLWQEETKAELATGGLPNNLSFDFFMPPWLGRLRAWGWRRGRINLTEQIVQTIWQILAVRYVRRRFTPDRFDLVHHITYGGIRYTTCMAGAPYPLVIGPLGGGERSPGPLRSQLPFLAYANELVRDLHTRMVRIEPMTTAACRKAAVIFVKTRESRDALAPRFRDKIQIEMEVGVPARNPPPRSVRATAQPLRLLYAGRLIHWKGLSFGLEALARARGSGVDAMLSIAGRGPAEPHWRELARRLDLENRVRFLGWVPFEEMQARYLEHDALLFPSLHDSSGNAVLEALSYGLPVICFDLGGPGAIVTRDSGRVVPTAGRSADACIAGLTAAIQELAHGDALRAALSQGALRRADDFRWPMQVVRVYGKIESVLRQGQGTR